MNDHKVNKHNLSSPNNPDRENYLPTKFIEKLMQSFSGQNILDYGCGIGYFTGLFSSIAADKKVYAVDVLPEAVEATKKRAMNLGNVEVYLSQETVAPLGDNVVGVAISIFTLHEFDDMTPVIDEFKRMISPSGKLIVIDWAPESPVANGPPFPKRISKQEAIEKFVSKGFSLFEDNQSIEPYCYTLIFKNDKNF